MPLSPSYNPVTSFANDETNTVAGRSTVRTAALDTELANAASSINGLKTNLEKIQRDDGKLKDFIVEPYALSDQARALITSQGKPKGLWAVNTLYEVGDVVQQASIAYICFTVHTSASPFTVNGFWIAISGDGSSAASAAAAAASQTASAASQTASAASAASASTSQTNASTSQTAAANSATSAGNSATAAAGSATSAANSAGSASGFNDAAYTAAINAQASAASVNLPTPLTGKQLNFLRVKADASGYEHRTALQARGDMGAAAAGANTDITSTGNNTSTVYPTTGTATAYAIVPNPAITAYTAGQAHQVLFGLASGLNPTIQINGLATPPNLVTLQANGTYANAIGIPAGHSSEVRLLSATQAWVVTMPPAFLSGSVIQTANFDTGAVATGTTLIPLDDTLPQQTEGDQYMSLSITPKVATSFLRIDVTIFCQPSTADWVSAAVFRDAAAGSIGAMARFQTTAGGDGQSSFSVRVPANSAVATTFKVRAGTNSAATITFNGLNGTRLFAGVMASSIRISEIAA